jgi:hypothetical protein
MVVSILLRRRSGLAVAATSTVGLLAVALLGRAGFGQRAENRGWRAGGRRQATYGGP